MPADSRSVDGFTLVEVLVSLVMLGLISGLMLAMMSQFRHLADAGQRLTVQAVLQKTVDHIAGTLERAEALPLELAPEGPLFFIKGGTDSARFLAIAKGGALKSGLFEIEISIEEKAGTKRLVETISPRRPAGEKEKVPFELLAPVERLTFSFLEKAENSASAPVWRSDWQFAGRLPEAVRITLLAKNKSGNLAEASAIAFLSR